MMGSSCVKGKKPNTVEPQEISKKDNPSLPLPKKQFDPNQPKQTRGLRRRKPCPFSIQALHGHTGGVNCLAVSFDQTRVASGSDDTTIRLWDSGSLEDQSVGVLTGHTGYVTCMIKFS